MNIAIVEDNILEYEDLKKHLTDIGHTVSPWLSNYEDAITHLQHSESHIALLDIDLKGPKNGLMLAEWIKTRQDIPVIFISNHTDSSIIDKAVSLSPFFVRKNSREHLAQIEVQLNLALKFHASIEPVRKSSILVIPHFTHLWAEAKKLNTEKKGPDPRTLGRNRVDYSDIFHISKDRDNGDYLFIETQDGAKYNHSLQLYEILPILPATFHQIERGSIINSDHISGRINAKCLEVNGKEIPVGKRYVDKVDRLMRQLFD